MHFLALLELYKHEHVELEQATTFATLVVAPTTFPARPLHGALADLFDLRATADVGMED